MSISVTVTVGEADSGEGLWCLDGFSENVEFRRMEDRSREYRMVVRIVVSRLLNEVTVITVNAALDSSGTDPGDILGESIYAANSTAMTALGTSGSEYSEMVVTSDRVMRGGPDGAEVMAEVIVFESVGDWKEYEFDEPENQE